MRFTAYSLSLLALLGALCGKAGAQPFIAYRGVVNAANFAPPGLPNGSIARGSIFSVFGTGLGPEAPALVESFPLGTELGGVSVELCQGGQCVQAIPLFVAAGQVNAIMPSNAPLGRGSLRLSKDGEAGNWSRVEVVESSVGVFSVNSGGFGPGIVQNFVAPDNQPINSLRTTARPGQVVTLWATGLGAGLNADNVAPQPGDLPVGVEIFVGGAEVTNRLYSGRSPCCAGVDQFVFEIPAEAPTGCWVPVQIRTNGQVVSNAVTIALNTSGAECPAVSASPSQGITPRNGNIFVESTQRFDALSGDLADSSWDILGATFRSEPQSDFAFEPNCALPPAGACIVHSGPGAINVNTPFASSGLGAADLDAGEEITMRAAGRSVGAHRTGGVARVYGAIFADGSTEQGTLGPSHAVVVQSAGGTDVGAFEVTLGAAPQLNWTNLASMAVINRAQGATVTWETAAGEADLVWITGGGADTIANAQTTFTCLAPASDGQFSIPSYVLSNINSSRGEILSHAWVSIAGIGPGSTATFEAPGVTNGTATRLVRVGRRVRIE